MNKDYLVILDSVNFFNEFTQAKKEEIASAYSNIIIYKADEYIIRQGDAVATENRLRNAFNSKGP